MRTLAVTTLSASMMTSLIVTASVIGVSASAATASPSTKSCVAALRVLTNSKTSATQSNLKGVAKSCTSLSQLEKAIKKIPSAGPANQAKPLAKAIKTDVCLIIRKAKMC
jgi:hypothetical protein